MFDHEMFDHEICEAFIGHALMRRFIKSVEVKHQGFDVSLSWRDNKTQLIAKMF
jgi:hypothetical protein